MRCLHTTLLLEVYQLSREYTEALVYKYHLLSVSYWERNYHLNLPNKMICWGAQRWNRSVFVGLEVKVGGLFLCLGEAPGLPSKESQDRWAVYLTRNPCILASTSLYSTLKSSTVFFKCWDWQLPRSLATLNNPPFKWSSPNPASVESSPEAHRGSLSAFHCEEGEVMSGAPKIPEGRIQQASYTASIIPASQGGFRNWGAKKRLP